MIVPVTFGDKRRIGVYGNVPPLFTTNLFPHLQVNHAVFYRETPANSGKFKLLPTGSNVAEATTGTVTEIADNRITVKDNADENTLLTFDAATGNSIPKQ